MAAVYAPAWEWRRFGGLSPLAGGQVPVTICHHGGGLGRQDLARCGASVLSTESNRVQSTCVMAPAARREQGSVLFELRKPDPHEHPVRSKLNTRSGSY